MVFVDFDVKGPQDSRYRHVGGAGDRELGLLGGAEVCGERFIVSLDSCTEVLGVPEHRSLDGIEAIGVSPLFKPVQLLLTHTGGQGHRQVVGEFIRRVFELGDPAYQQLPECARHCRLETDRMDEIQQRREHLGGVRERSMQVDRFAFDFPQSPQR